MDVLRSYLAILLAVALAAYGTAAISAAHSHAASGFHAVHVVVDHHPQDRSHHHGDADKIKTAQLDQGGVPPGPATDHHDSEFHCHGAPQFGPAYSMSLMVVALASQRTQFLDADGMAANARDESPFKPPRLFL